MSKESRDSVGVPRPERVQRQRSELDLRPLTQSSCRPNVAVERRSPEKQYRDHIGTLRLNPGLSDKQPNFLAHSAASDGR